MRRDSSSPEAYRADVPEPQRSLLDTIREIVFEAAPDVEEGIRYGMLDYPGLANLAAQKDYVALYVAPEVLARWKGELAGVSTGKSCVRYRRTSQVDRAVLTGLLRDVRALRQQQAAGS